MSERNRELVALIPASLLLTIGFAGVFVERSDELTNLSLPKIGQLFGNRDHTTVMYANKKISELMKERRLIYNQVTGRKRNRIR